MVERTGIRMSNVDTNFCTHKHVFIWVTRAFVTLHSLSRMHGAQGTHCSSFIHVCRPKYSLQAYLSIGLSTQMLYAQSHYLSWPRCACRGRIMSSGNINQSYGSWKACVQAPTPSSILFSLLLLPFPPPRPPYLTTPSPLFLSHLLVSVRPSFFLRCLAVAVFSTSNLDCSRL